MLQGINIEATLKLAQAVSIPIIASGGLTSMVDIDALCAIENDGVMGVIAGRAIYNGNINLADAQKYADEKNPPEY
jgi:phosphoribosylformimino-5-aminoimidazole carboxamide ribotide isomerase